MRCILHSDLNNFYASVELLKHPELRGRAVAVCGSKEDRHGIVLAKNQFAKQAGVKTGDAIWQAEKKCPGIVQLPADFSAYLRVSKAVRKIYERYTDRVEAYGIDECWLDVTQTQSMFGGGLAIAEQIRAAVKGEIGVTVSVGVSWNKIFSKLASDMQKPDAVTVISPENYRECAWRLSVEDLLYVGAATARKLKEHGISTIGQLAQADAALLRGFLGKWGDYLHTFANGQDQTPVCRREEEQNIKSIGNSLTCYRDLESDEDIYMLLLLLSDSVAARLRESAFGKAKTVHLSVTDSSLAHWGKQGKLPYPSKVSADIAACAFRLYKQVYPGILPVRALGVSVCGFTGENDQMNIFADILGQNRQEKMEDTLDKLRKRYGNNIIQRAAVLKDARLKQLDIKGEHVIHPENFFGK